MINTCTKLVPRALLNLVRVLWYLALNKYAFVFIYFSTDLWSLAEMFLCSHKTVGYHRD